MEGHEQENNPEKYRRYRERQRNRVTTLEQDLERARGEVGRLLGRERKLHLLLLRFQMQLRSRDREREELGRELQFLRHAHHHHLRRPRAVVPASAPPPCRPPSPLSHQPATSPCPPASPLLARPQRRLSRISSSLELLLHGSPQHHSLQHQHQQPFQGSLPRLSSAAFEPGEGVATLFPRSPLASLRSLCDLSQGEGLPASLTPPRLRSRGSDRDRDLPTLSQPLSPRPFSLAPPHESDGLLLREEVSDVLELSAAEFPPLPLSSRAGSGSFVRRRSSLRTFRTVASFTRISSLELAPEAGHLPSQEPPQLTPPQQDGPASPPPQDDRKFKPGFYSQLFRSI